VEPAAGVTAGEPLAGDAGERLAPGAEERLAAEAAGADAAAGEPCGPLLQAASSAAAATAPTRFLMLFICPVLVS
jgi:hypothetical protein